MTKNYSSRKKTFLWIITLLLVVPTSSQAFTWSGLLSDLYNRYRSQSTTCQVLIPTVTLAALAGSSWWYSSYLARQREAQRLQEEPQRLWIEECRLRGEQRVPEIAREMQNRAIKIQLEGKARENERKRKLAQQEQQRIQSMMQHVNQAESSLPARMTEEEESDLIAATLEAQQREKEELKKIERRKLEQERLERMRAREAKKELEEREKKKEQKSQTQRQSSAKDQLRLAREESIKRNLNMANVLNTISDINKELSPETIESSEQLLKEPFNQVLTYSKQAHKPDLTNAIEHWMNPPILTQEANDPDAAIFRPSNATIQQLKYLNTKRVIYKTFDELTQNGQLKELREQEINNVIFPQLLAIEHLQPTIQPEQEISTPEHNAEKARIATIKDTVKLVQQFVNNNNKAVNNRSSYYQLAHTLNEYISAPSLLLPPPNAETLTQSLKNIYNLP